MGGLCCAVQDDDAGAPSNNGTRSLSGSPKPSEMWEFMACVLIKDLGEGCVVHRVEMHCMGLTTIAQLQHHVETLLTSDPDFASAQAKLTAIVPVKAPDWSDACTPEQTIREVERTYGFREGDEPRDDSWNCAGQPMPGVRFYATCGEPTGAGGFAFWELDSVSNVTYVRINHQGHTTRGRPDTGGDNLLVRSKTGTFR
eukprot:TRINITY_DN8487_c0_g2_i1.p1 TRINITY_DN8487_c0_g2~~TRINITY_DN8487_c0_g2_i1.p1  ORF type:complete len:199 (-),score=29.37 TRINITY_DN8487_c0_g2_i1:187-783(-)